MAKRSKIRKFFEDLKDKGIGILWILFAGFWVWVLFQMLYIFYEFSFFEWIQTVHYVWGPFQYFVTTIGSGTALGIFYLFLFSSLFFLPVPLEVLFLTLARRADPVFIATYAILGILVGQVINYMLGRLFSIIFIAMLKRSTQKSAKEKLAKYGGFSIGAVHLIPFPFQIFNVVTGLFKFPFWNWLMYATIGLVLKHVILVGIALSV